MALWILLVLGAVFLYSLVNIFNKHIVSDELKDPLAASAIHTIPFFIFSAAVTFFFGSFAINPGLIGILLFVGFLDYIMSILYFKSAQLGEISRTVAMIHTAPIIVMLLSFIFLNEVLSLGNYASLFLIIIGAIILEYHTSGNKPKKSAPRSIMTIIR